MATLTVLFPLSLPPLSAGTSFFIARHCADNTLHLSSGFIGLLQGTTNLLHTAPSFFSFNTFWEWSVSVTPLSLFFLLFWVRNCLFSFFSFFLFYYFAFVFWGHTKIHGLVKQSYEPMDWWSKTVLFWTVFRGEYDISKIITFASKIGSVLSDYSFEAAFPYTSDQINHFPLQYFLPVLF